MKRKALTFYILLFYSLAGFAAESFDGQTLIPIEKAVNPTDTATFASGCFWCVEAKFSQLNGVLKVSSGYTGGRIANPSYEQVCTGTTGHAEACTIVYDPEIISYDELLEAFFYPMIPRN